MSNAELLLEVHDSHEAIDLIDDLREHGIDAELADVPGTWDVATDGPIEEVAEIVSEHLRP